MLWQVRVLANTAVLALFSADGLAQLTSGPFGDLWRTKGVTVSNSGRGVSLRWPAVAYQHQLPGYPAIKWEEGGDIRLKSEVMISRRVPGIASDGEPLEAALRLPRHPDAQNQDETDDEVKKILSAGENGLIGLIGLLGTKFQEESTPVRVRLGAEGSEFSSFLVQYPMAPARSSVIKPLEPSWVLSALVSEIAVNLTLHGDKVQAVLRFKPDAALALAGRAVVEHCAESHRNLTEPGVL